MRLSDLSIHDRAALWKHVPSDVFGSEYCESWARDLFEVGNWHAAVAFLLVLFSSSLKGVGVHGFWDFPEQTVDYINTVLNYASQKFHPRSHPFFPKPGAVFSHIHRMCRCLVYDVIAFMKG